jgi:hypothetical protein
MHNIRLWTKQAKDKTVGKTIKKVESSGELGGDHRTNGPTLIVSFKEKTRNIYFYFPYIIYQLNLAGIDLNVNLN